MSLTRCVLAALMLSIGHAAAQQAAPTPEVEALQRRVLSMLTESVSCSAEAIALRRQLDEMTKQIADAKK
jgi:ABC-type transporter MlaC component